MTAEKQINNSDEKLDIDSAEEKDELNKKNEEAKAMLDFIKDSLDGAVSRVRFTNKLKNYAVCLTSEGGISLEMEKVLNAMPNDNKVKAEVVLEISSTHPISEKLKAVYAESEVELENYAKLLYAQACLISGIPVKDPAEFSRLVSDLMVK